MYRGKSIAVVVPAWNEEPHIGKVLEGMPQFVDVVYVVDDASTDRTADIVRAFIANSRTHAPTHSSEAGALTHSRTHALTHSSVAGALTHSSTHALTHSCEAGALPHSRTAAEGPRIELVQHARNSGVGAAIVSGYKCALADGMDIAAVMAGDNQMEPEWLPKVLDPVIDGRADYSKGTRVKDLAHLKGMSPWRRLGNFTLRWLTVIASGNPAVTDPQHGYAAISREALERLDLDAVYPYYGYCNDLVVRLSAQHRRVVEVPMPSMYHGEVSKIRYHRYIPKVSMLLLRLFVWRVTGRLSASRRASPGSPVTVEGRNA